MKQIKLITVSVVAIASLLLASCAGFQGNVEKTLGSPQQVQADVYNAGTIAFAHASPKVKAAVHAFNVRLGAASELNLAELIALVPKTGDANADAAIAAAVSYLNSAVQKFGSHNPTTLAYFRAANAGLTQAGF